MRHQARIWHYLLLLLLGLPLLWLNVGPSHDWGGDFAQYLQQAQNIATGRPIAESGYVYNPAYPMLGPPAYPPGYPLLLAPVYALFGNDMLAFIRYQSLLLLALGLILLAFFRRRFSPLSSLLLVLLVWYNPWTLTFKRELMSDIPFALFLLLALWCFERKQGVWAGLFAGFSILIRSIGWAWVAALLPLLLIGGVKYLRERGTSEKRALRQELMLPLAALAGAVALPLLANAWVFHVPSGLALYRQNLEHASLIRTVFDNLAYYVDVVQWFFQVPAREGRFLTLATKAVMFTLILIGGINRWLERPRLIDWLLLAYLAVLLLYPYRAGGFRFLFPLLPVLWVYAVAGFQSIGWRRTLPLRWRPLLLGAILLLPYYPGISSLLRKGGRVEFGPQKAEAQEAFEALRRLTPEQAVVVFVKPRVLAFYTGRRSTALGREQSLAEADAWLDQVDAGYALRHLAQQDPVLEQILASAAFEEIWSNSHFFLYQRKPQSIPLNP